MSPSPENFCKIESEMVQSGAHFTSKLPDQAHCLICHFVVFATLLLQLIAPPATITAAAAAPTAFSAAAADEIGRGLTFRLQ